MKYSNYNHLVKVPDEQSWILYNFLSGAMIQLDEENKSIYEQILQDDAYASEKALLTENGFLVDYDELFGLRISALVLIRKHFPCLLHLQWDVTFPARIALNIIVRGL